MYAFRESYGHVNYKIELSGDDFCTLAEILSLSDIFVGNVEPINNVCDDILKNIGVEKLLLLRLKMQLALIYILASKLRSCHPIRYVDM